MIWLLLVSVRAAAELLPERVARWLGHNIGWLIWVAIPLRRKLMRRNMCMALGVLPGSRELRQLERRLDSLESRMAVLEALSDYRASP